MVEQGIADGTDEAAARRDGVTCTKCDSRRRGGGLERYVANIRRGRFA